MKWLAFSDGSPIRYGIRWRVCLDGLHSPVLGRSRMQGLYFAVADGAERILMARVI